MTRGLEPAQQLRLLGGELLVAENPLVAQVGELLDGRQHVLLAGDRLIAKRVDLPRRRWRARSRHRRLLRHAVYRDDRQAGHVDQSVLARKAKRAAIGLLLREAADLVIECAPAALLSEIVTPFLKAKKQVVVL